MENSVNVEKQQNPKEEASEETPSGSSQHSQSQMVRPNSSVLPTQHVCVGVAVRAADSTSQSGELNR